MRRETPESWHSIIAMTLVSGVANGTLLALVNAGASAAASEEVSFRLLLMFLIAIATFIAAKKYALGRSMIIVEGMVKRLRVRICDKIRKSELPFIETLGKGTLYTTVSQDANLISQSAFVITNASQEAVMLVFALIYIAWLSPLALLIILGSIGIALYFYNRHRKSMHGDLALLATKDAAFLDSLGHLIDGFKEAKLNRRKNDSLFASFTRVADATEDLKVRLGVKFVMDIMFSHVFFYILLAVIVFLLPRVVPTFSEVVLKMTAAVLFIIAPLEMIVGAMPMFARSDVALDNLYRLERHLDRLEEETHQIVPERLEAFRQFKTISLESAVFSYADGTETFTVGPVDLSIRRGEMLFIVGGNGSGKSTLLKLLTGLYQVKSGVLRLDHEALNTGNLQSYRELFSAIFTDFHLFDRFYGLEEVYHQKVEALIREMQLQDKTKFEAGRFSNLNLSTGQKKRLAYIIALLEDREIYVFDEWAADQDVEFREKFYLDLLPGLKSRQKTVIAITHDDRYWNVADRMVKLEYGKVVAETHFSQVGAGS
jgi:putative ATP-binding cassette transporter